MRVCIYALNLQFLTAHLRQYLKLISTEKPAAKRVLINESTP
jgi:hypothetical protein